jgi:hypothetical protein
VPVAVVPWLLEEVSLDTRVAAPVTRGAARTNWLGSSDDQDWLVVSTIRTEHGA